MTNKGGEGGKKNFGSNIGLNLWIRWAALHCTAVPPWPAHVMFHHLICGEILEGLWPAQYMLYRTLFQATDCDHYILSSTLYTLGLRWTLQCCRWGPGNRGLSQMSPAPNGTIYPTPYAIDFKSTKSYSRVPGPGWILLAILLSILSSILLNHKWYWQNCWQYCQQYWWQFAGNIVATIVSNIEDSTILLTMLPAIIMKNIWCCLQ